MKPKEKLAGVQQTLLLPLIGRAYFSQKKNGLLIDKKAEELLSQFEFNKRKTRWIMGQTGLLSMAVRAIKMDEAIRKFIQKYPKATIVNVGAGLDTAFWRVDNGQIKWVDLDLPEVMEMRQKYLPPSGRNMHIAKSVFDYSWIEDIGDTSEGVFIQVPGVFPYIDKEVVIDFFKKISPIFPETEVIFDVVSKFTAGFISNGIKRSGISNAPLKWGIDTQSEVLDWSDKLEIIRHQGYFEDIQKKLTYYPTTNLLMAATNRLKLAQIFHLKIKS